MTESLHEAETDGTMLREGTLAEAPGRPDEFPEVSLEPGLAAEQRLLHEASLYGKWITNAPLLRRAGRSIPYNLTLLCGYGTHEGFEWWGEDGRLRCGVCHPPVNGRWASTGGPLGFVPALNVRPAHAPTAALEPAKTPTRRGRRAEVVEGQGSLIL